MTTAKLSPERKEEIRELYREQHGQGWYRTVISELLAHIAEVEGQLGGSKDLWDEVAIVLDEAGIPASERSPEGSPCYIATSNRVKELCAELAKVRQELEAVIAVKDSYKYRGDAAEAALRSRDEAVREARAQGMRDAAEIAEAAEDIDPEPTKELGDARARAAGQIARAIRERAAAERLEKIVGGKSNG